MQADALLDFQNAQCRWWNQAEYYIVGKSPVYDR